MLGGPPEYLKVNARYQDLIEAARLTAKSVFTDPRINIWRKLPDRENGTLDVPIPDVGTIRLHIKRYPGSGSLTLPSQIEVRGYHALLLEGIPTARLVAFGKLKDRRSFTIFANLDHHKPADKLIESGVSFEKILIPTADLAAKLHNQNLHHRDLYLCHFMANVDESPADIKLIDTARVARLKTPFTRKRWIVKDLAQFWYSTTRLHITNEQRERWLARYAQQRGQPVESFRHAIDRKVFSIARHDTRLNAKQPQRNISIPT